MNSIVRFAKNKFFGAWLVAVLVLSWQVSTRLHYLIHTHDSFDYSVKTIQFDYLESDSRGRLPHIFRAYKNNEEIKLFRYLKGHPFTPLYRKDLYKLEKGVIYYFNKSDRLFGGVSVYSTMVGVQFDNGLTLGNKEKPRGYVRGVYKRTLRGLILCTAGLVVCLLIAVFMVRNNREIRSKDK